MKPQTNEVLLATESREDYERILTHLDTERFSFRHVNPEHLKGCKCTNLKVIFFNYKRAWEKGIKNIRNIANLSITFLTDDSLDSNPYSKP